MIKALLRYLFFTTPNNFLRGLEFVIFDKEEIVHTSYTVQEQYNKALKERRILLEHLERCRKQIYKKGKESE